MKVTHKVYNSDGSLEGYLIDGTFYNKVLARKAVEHVDNLYMLKNKELRVKHGMFISKLTLNDLNVQRYKQAVHNAPFVRDAQKQFLKWYNIYSNKILYLKGARQVGKTTELLKFAYKRYEYVIYVNLADKAVLRAFMQACTVGGSTVLNVTNFCAKMNMPTYHNSKKTILILDEIQVSSDIFNSLRTLRRELKCSIAVTGSYLGAVINSEFFQPAGDTYDVELMPLSYREFVRVFGKENVLADISITGESAESYYEELTQLYKLYLNIGGFPAVVAEYRKYKDIDACKVVLKQLFDRFTAESAAYFEEGSKMRLVFDNVYKATLLTQLTEKKGTGKELTELITQFIKADTKTFITRSEVNKAVSWLFYNNVLGASDLYIDCDVKQIQFSRRCYFKDTGILSYMATIVPMTESDKNGLLAETFVYNELYRLYNVTENKQVIGDKPACATYNDFELDYLIFAAGGKRFGIEVKSKHATSVSSLKAMQDAKLIDCAVVAELTKGGNSGERITIPIYAVAEKFPYGCTL